MEITCLTVSSLGLLTLDSSSRRCDYLRGLVTCASRQKKRMPTERLVHHNTRSEPAAPLFRQAVVLLLTTLDYIPFVFFLSSMRGVRMVMSR